MAEQVVIPYINEIVPARFRGRAVALSGGFNGVFQIFATCIMYGCSQLQSDWQWRIPLISMFSSKGCIVAFKGLTDL